MESPSEQSTTAAQRVTIIPDSPTTPTAGTFASSTEEAQFCWCGLNAVINRVRKIGKNTGRYFWRCPRFGTDEDESKCDYFRWVDEKHPYIPHSMLNNRPGLGKTMPTSNITNYFPVTSAASTSAAVSSAPNISTLFANGRSNDRDSINVGQQLRQVKFSPDTIFDTSSSTIPKFISLQELFQLKAQVNDASVPDTSHESQIPSSTSLFSASFKNNNASIPQQSATSTRRQQTPSTPPTSPPNYSTTATTAKTNNNTIFITSSGVTKLQEQVSKLAAPEIIELFASQMTRLEKYATTQEQGNQLAMTEIQRCRYELEKLRQELSLANRENDVLKREKVLLKRELDEVTKRDSVRDGKRARQ
ncbi:8243_t:CDS:2 [Ambispora gerdemannii]|uniref:8243_t:CDS:1 n=1 Tax=Ambispora gerdemannii TaxID=144530 RepID=A0A9N8ZQZ5_9GLOM|nr:8243_t:CDS:2 [Ambispora gerdemannii]